MELIGEVEVHNGLGECVLWDDQSQVILWTDIPGQVLYRYTPDTRALVKTVLHQDLHSFCLVENSQMLLGAFRDGLAWLDPDSGEANYFYHLEHADQLRLNDGRVDDAGRFWVGSLIDLPGNRSADPEITGKLFRVDTDLTVSEHLRGIGITNSLCWSPDYTYLYLADSVPSRIDRYPFDLDTGTLGTPRPFVQNAPQHNPDGSVTDADGYLWNALWGSSEVVRYSPTGEKTNSLQLPASQPACVTFGGPNLDWLIVTTASYSLDDSQRLMEPKAGNLFIYQGNSRGKLENRFRAG